MAQDKSKYNSTSKSAEWFPFKKRIFQTTNHPIFNSKEKCSYKAETLLSFQERQMLDGMVSSLQCEKRDAIRIAIDTLHQQGSSVDDDIVKSTKSGTKNQGHTSRSTSISIRVTKEDAMKLDDIREFHSLTSKEGLRLSIIWMAKGIKNDSIKKISGCSELNPDQKANEWKANQKEIKKHPSTQRLKEVRKFYKEHFEEQKSLRKKEKKINKQEALARKMGMPTYDEVCEDRFNQLINEQELIAEEINTREREILWIMSKYQVDHESATLWYEDDQAELEAIAQMTTYELMQHLKKKKEEEGKWSKKYIEEEEKRRRQNLYPPGYIPAYKTRSGYLNDRVRGLNGLIDHTHDDDWWRKYFEEIKGDEAEKFIQMRLQEQAEYKAKLKLVEIEIAEMHKNGTEDERHPDSL